MSSKLPETEPPFVPVISLVETRERQIAFERVRGITFSLDWDVKTLAPKALFERPKKHVLLTLFSVAVFAHETFHDIAARLNIVTEPKPIEGKLFFESRPHMGCRYQYRFVPDASAMLNCMVFEQTGRSNILDLSVQDEHRQYFIFLNPRGRRLLRRAPPPTPSSDDVS